MTEQAIRIQRQQTDLKTVLRLIAIKEKEKFDNCMKFWNGVLELKDLKDK